MTGLKEFKHREELLEFLGELTVCECVFVESRSPPWVALFPICQQRKGENSPVPPSPTLLYFYSVSKFLTSCK